MNPRTEAGRRLLDQIAPAVSDAAAPEEEWAADSWARRNDIEDAILAIEAEAARTADRPSLRAADLDRLLEAVVAKANRSEAAAIELRDQRLVDRWRGVAEGAKALAAALRQALEDEDRPEVEPVRVV